MTDTLAGRAFLVVGGSGSVGQATAARLRAAGATVAVHGRRPRTAQAACRALAEDGGAVPPALSGDIGEAGVAAAIVAQAHDALGGLDGVVNCAVQAPPGITGAFADTDPASYTPLLHDAVTQVQWLLHAAAPVLAAGGGGAFVTLVSDAALFAARGQSLIAASRAAVVAFCRNAALDLAARGVRVNCVSAGYIADSAIVAALAAQGSARLDSARRRAGLGLPTVADVADLCGFLLGPGAGRVTGQVISINGGMNA